MKGEKSEASGFFCEIDSDLPFKHALFTNNHVLTKSHIEIGNTITFEYFLKSSDKIDKIVKKKLKLTNNRKVFTNEELDYTCIELFKSDKIFDYFKIDPKLFKSEKNFLEDNDIFILQYPKGNNISFSSGKVLSLENNQIKHNASTEKGSSGSPIIRRCQDNYII